MKQFYSTLILLLTISFCNAQNQNSYFKVWQQPNTSMPKWAQMMYSSNPHVPTVIKLYEKFYKDNLFEKSTHTQNYKFWLQQISEQVNEQGYIKAPKTYQQVKQEFDEALDVLESREQSPQNGTERIAGALSQWVNISPKDVFNGSNNYPISHFTNVYSIQQSPTNPNLVICGTEPGGVFKSLDKGITWTPINAHVPYAGGNTAVAINPVDDNNYLHWGNQKLLRTADGGTTWTQIVIPTTAQMHEIKFNPTHPDTVYAIGESGLWRSADTGKTFSQIFNSQCWDLDFQPGNTNTIYLLKNNSANKTAELFRSDDGGSTWVLKNSGYYVPENLSSANDGGGKIAVSNAAPDMVYVCLLGESKAGDNGWIGVWRSTNKGENWVNPVGQRGGPYGASNSTGPWNVGAYDGGIQQGFYNFDLEASNTDAGKIWIGTVRLTESTDSGKTFQSIGSANTTRLQDIHSDIQSISVQGNEIFVATDGGVDYSNDELQTKQYRSHNLTDVNFWQFHTGWNEQSYTGGTYHDGTMGWHLGLGVGNVIRMGGVEEASGYVHPIEARKMIYRTHYGASECQVRILPDAIGQTLKSAVSYPVRPNEDYNEARTSGFYYHPHYANIIYMGYQNKIYKSTNGGGSWNVIHSLSNTAALIFEMEISVKDPNVIYCTFNPDGGYWTSMQMMKSIDGGLTWNPISIATVPSSKWKIAMTLNPKDENEIWICFGDAQGTNPKVYKSLDGGAIWTNTTTATLNNKEIIDIAYVGAPTALVYGVSLKGGVFYYNTTTSTWVDYSLGLPAYPKGFRIHPYFKDNELMMGSHRGAWARSMADSNYLPTAQPMTYSDSINCAKDTVQFDDHSHIAHTGASWSWTFTPTPLYVSNANSRNPRVVFGAVGAYTLSLSVTDANSNSDTKTINNMVYVKETCGADSTVGNSIVLTGNNSSNGAAGPLNKSTNNFTISAWIKRNGAQNGSAGIVFMRGTSANGINFTGSNLGYHWNGDQWWWNSGHTVPDNKWTHVALVITPTRATMYMDGVPRHNVTAHPVVNLVDNLVIGLDANGGNRAFKGEIDEVCVWNRALDSNEIRSLRHLTKEDTINDPSFLVYYQFNEGSANAIDKKGLNHVALSNVTSVLSTAPVGSGSSHQLNVNAAGTYSFTNAGCEMTFAPGTVPNGNIVVTRLNNVPDSLPTNQMLHNNYWIVNNYGPNKTFTPLTSMKLYPTSAVTIGTAANIEKRVDNEHINNWGVQCTTSNVQTGSNGYYEMNELCNNNTFSQFVVTSFSAPLSNDILNFVATVNSNYQVILDWKILSTTSPVNFQVEHCVDGINFSSIGMVDANSNSRYTFNHNTPSKGRNYYRLKLNKLNQGSSYSEVRQVDIQHNAVGISIYPNPVKSGEGFIFQANNLAPDAVIKLYNMNGQIVAQARGNADNSFIITQKLSSGLYFYSLYSGELIRTGKLAVE